MRLRSMFGWPKVDRVIAVTAVVAAMAAAGALILSVHESRENRRHDRLSVQPVLTFETTTSPGLREPFGITIHNTGLGPATLRDVALYSTDLEFVTSLQVLSAVEVHQSIGDYFDLPSGTLHLSLYGGFRTLSAGDEMPIITSPDDSQEWNAGFADALSKMNVVACYCSIYDECWIASMLPGLPVSPGVLIGDATAAGDAVASCEPEFGPNGCRYADDDGPD